MDLFKKLMIIVSVFIVIYGIILVFVGESKSEKLFNFGYNAMMIGSVVFALSGVFLGGSTILFSILEALGIIAVMKGFE